MPGAPEPEPPGPPPVVAETRKKHRVEPPENPPGNKLPRGHGQT